MRQVLVSPVDPQQTVQQQTEISSSKIRKTRVKKAVPDAVLGNPEQASSSQQSTDPTPIRDTLQARFPRSSGQPIADLYDEDRQTLIDYLADFAREFGDRAALKSTVTRVTRLYERSGLERQVFIEQMYRARAITKERSGSIRSGKFAYFLTVLEDLVGLREDDESAVASR